MKKKLKIEKAGKIKENTQKRSSKILEIKGNGKFNLQFDNNLRKFLDAAVTPLLIIEKENGLIREVNKAAQKFYNLTRHKLLKKNFGELHSKNFELPSKEGKYQIAGGEKKSRVLVKLESVAISKSLFYLASVTENNNQPLTPTNFSNDLAYKTDGLFVQQSSSSQIETANYLASEWKQRIEALIYDNIYDAIIITDLEGTITNWNKTASEMYGYVKEEVIGRNVDFLNEKDVGRKLTGDIRQSIELFGEWKGEINFIRKNGKKGISETVVFPVRGNGNEIFALVGVNKDITDRKSAEKELRESEKQFRCLFEDSPVSLWEEDMSEVKKELDKLTSKGVTDLRTYFAENPQIIGKLIKKISVLNVNKATLRLHNAGSKQELIENFDRIFTDESKKVFTEGIISLFEKHSFYEGETSNYTLTGSMIYISMKASVVSGFEDSWELILISEIDMTENQKSQAALRESEDKFRKIAEKSLIGIYLIQDGIFKYVNPKFADIFEYFPEDIINNIGPNELTHENDRHLVKENISRRIVGEVDSINYGFNAVTGTGRIISVEVFGSRIIYMGKPAVVGTLVDITERKKSEQALKESKRRYKELTDLLPQTIFEVNGEGILTFLNQAGCEAFGYMQEQLVSNASVYDLIAPKDRGRAAADMLKMLKGENKKETEYTAIRKNGSTFPVVIYSNPIQRQGASAAGLRGILVDITERKQNEDQLRILSRSVEQNPSSIVITNIFGEIEYVNPRFTEITGYSFGEVMGKNPRILKSGQTHTNIYEDLWSTITSGNTWRGELHNKKANGDLYWEYASISSIINSDGKITHFIAIKEDITEKKQIENELLRAKEKAEESDRLKSEFLAQVSHEIRSPLNIIMSYNTLLKEELSGVLNDDQNLALVSIDSAGKRLLRTIDLILNMAALQNGYIDIKPTNVNLKDLLPALIKEFEYTANSKNLNMYFTSTVESGFVLGDEYILSEIFENLIGNAIKYTVKGKVHIYLYENAEKKLCVEVEDTGIGIAKDYLPKLFVPFSQEESGYSRKFEGNGLGLALVKKYVDLLNARIKVESEKGTGSKFTVMFKRLSGG